MADLSALRARLDDLKHKRSSGVRSVEEDGRRVEYRKDPEFAAAIAALENEIAQLEGRGSARSFVIRSNKGW